MNKFILWIKSFFSDDRDLQRFYLSVTKVDKDNYTREDRYRDFVLTFSTPEGKRVLSQIISKAEGLPTVESEVSDTHKTAYRAGRRSLGLWIVRVLNAEPL